MMRELQAFRVIEKDDTDLYRDGFVDRKKIVEACESLVVHDESSGIVKITHYSAQQVLLEDNLLPPDSALAETRLTYLSFKVFDQGPCQDSAVFDRVAEYPGNIYPSRYWYFHVKKGENNPDIYKAVLQAFTPDTRRHSMWQISQVSRTWMVRRTNNVTRGM